MLIQARKNTRLNVTCLKKLFIFFDSAESRIFGLGSFCRMFDLLGRMWGILSSLMLVVYITSFYPVVFLALILRKPVFPSFLWFEHFIQIYSFCLSIDRYIEPRVSYAEKSTSLCVEYVIHATKNDLIFGDPNMFRIHPERYWSKMCTRYHHRTFTEIESPWMTWKVTPKTNMCRIRPQRRSAGGLLRTECIWT